MKVKPAHRSTSSDVCYVPDNIPALEGFGPIGGESRSPYEYIMRDSHLKAGFLEELQMIFPGHGKRM